MQEPVGNPDREPTELPLICTCDAEGLARAEALVAEVIRRLASATEQHGPREVTPSNFVSELARSLRWDFSPGVSIEGIDSDMWFGVRAADDLHQDPVFVPCDRVEDGLAAIWLYYADKRGAQAQEV